MSSCSRWDVKGFSQHGRVIIFAFRFASLGLILVKASLDIMNSSFAGHFRGILGGSSSSSRTELFCERFLSLHPVRQISRSLVTIRGSPYVSGTGIDAVDGPNVGREIHGPAGHRFAGEGRLRGLRAGDGARAKAGNRARDFPCGERWQLGVHRAGDPERSSCTVDSFARVVCVSARVLEGVSRGESNARLMKPLQLFVSVSGDAAVKVFH